MPDSNPRYVTLRHADSGRWCIEAPHPQYGMPQPYFLPGTRLLDYRTLAAAVGDIERAGYTLVKNLKTGLRFVYRDGKPVQA